MTSKPSEVNSRKGKTRRGPQGEAVKLEVLDFQNRPAENRVCLPPVIESFFGSDRESRRSERSRDLFISIVRRNLQFASPPGSRKRRDASPKLYEFSSLSSSP